MEGGKLVGTSGEGRGTLSLLLNETLPIQFACLARVAIVYCSCSVCNCM